MNRSQGPAAMPDHMAAEVHDALDQAERRLKGGK